MIKPIGGYFEWEFPPATTGSFPHSEGVLLNSGRHALEYILKSLGEIKRIWIPYFTCDVVLQPIERLGIPYTFYHINKELKLAEDYIIAEGEYLIYTNYFGIMDRYCFELATHYGRQLILDNAQAFYAPHLESVNTFYSPRKYVGIPDGGIAYTNQKASIELEIDRSYNRCIHLLKRHELAPMEGYDDFKDCSHQIAVAPLANMSYLTQRMLQSLDYVAIKKRRVDNFSFLHAHLAEYNELNIPSMDSFLCPMVYPYWAEDDSLRAKLIDHKIFVATYWPNVLSWVDNASLEYSLVKYIIPIPIDQRYGIDDMNRIINTILYE